MAKLEFDPGMIVWDADIFDKTTVSKVITSGALPKGTVIRLGRFFLEGQGNSFIKWCQDRGYPVFCDTHFIGQPHEIMNVASVYLQRRPCMLSIMGMACSTGNFGQSAKMHLDALKQFCQLCDEKARTRSCVVTSLVSKTWDLADREFANGAVEQEMFYADQANRAGATDILCSKRVLERLSGREYRRLRTIVRVTEDDLPESNTATIEQAIRGKAKRLMFNTLLTRGDDEIENNIAHNYVEIWKEMGRVAATMDAED